MGTKSVLLWIAGSALSLALYAAGCPGTSTVTPAVRASDVFFDGGPNSKAAGSIIKKDVYVAGWLLSEPMWNGCAEAEPRCEDVHYDIMPDPEFIARNYGQPGSALAGVFLLGNPPDAAKRLPLSDGPRGITVNSFFLPGNLPANYYRNEVLRNIAEQCRQEDRPAECRRLVPTASVHVELNAWHKDGGNGWTGRGDPPAGWIRDPQHPDTFWPFNPKDPDGRGDLRVGDYVLMTGTLWQDVAHYGSGTGLCRFLGGFLCGSSEAHPDLEQQDCWGRGALKPHGGWIELHPVDWIARAEPYADRPRYSVFGLALCAPVEAFDASRTADIKFAPFDPKPSPSATLRVVELVDPRFTEDRNIDEHEVRVVGDSVEVHVKVHSSGTLSFQAREGRLKAAYLVWWER